MEINNGFSLFMFLSENLTKEERNNCFKTLVDYEFKGYDFKTGESIEIDELLIKYPNRQQYSTIYKNKKFGISCMENDDFIVLRADNSVENFEITIKVINQFSHIIKNVNFAYLDSEGDSPKKMEKLIDELSISWLFKYNYFGKAFIEKYGKDFFVNMPCVRQEFIAEDIIRIDLSEDISSPIEESLAKEVLNYLKTYSIDPSFYNYKKFLID